MKQIKLVVLSLASLVFGRPAGFCTANTLTEDVAAVNAQLDTLKAESAADKARIAALEKQLATPPPAAPAPESTLDLLCKGAAVDIADVRWRIQSGLAPEQAVEAAIAQKAHSAAAAAKK
jgi:hypothetical protein